MQLHYLDFEFSDEESGRGSFDAMASVLPERLPALLAEIAAVLRWAHDAFGAAGTLDDDGAWDHALDATAEPDRPLPVAYDAARGEVSLAAPADSQRVTLTLTLVGPADFCAAFREAFGLES